MTQIEDAADSLQEYGFNPYAVKHLIFLEHNGEEAAYFRFNNPESLEYNRRLENTELYILKSLNPNQIEEENRRKKVKHEILGKLFACGILKENPGNNWEDITL